MQKITKPKKGITYKIGWSEFITNKKTMLDAFEKVKEQTQKRPTKTDKGKPAEAAIRAWLTQFLPKKYAVTSGYIISQGLQAKNDLYQYDVIIYDALNAPVLWVEENADTSEQGKVRAIPAENVFCVLEIKSTLNEKSAKEAKAKLWELEPLLKHSDSPTEIYKKYLPDNFYMGIVFFELFEKDKTKMSILENLIPEKTTNDLRGYLGGIVLQAEGKDKNLTGKINFGLAENPINAFGDLMNVAMTNSIQTQEGKHYSAMINWTTSEFATFAFDLVAMLNGTYRNGYVSSFLGLPIPIIEQKK